MSYRDELGAAQSRITALERELKDAKEELSSKALVPVGKQALVERPGQQTARRWLGAKTRYRGERVVEGEIGENTYADIVQTIADGFDAVGRSSTVPGRLDWASASPSSNGSTTQLSISVTSSNGRTVIRGEVRIGGLAGAVFGGVGGGVGLGGIMVPGALFFINPIAGAIGVAGWLGGAFWGCRKIFRKMSKKRGLRLEEVLDAIEEVVQNAPKIVNDNTPGDAAQS